jgi:hypothetical protein
MNSQKFMIQSLHMAIGKQIYLNSNLEGNKIA